jgi:hypothetical protein
MQQDSNQNQTIPQDKKESKGINQGYKDYGLFYQNGFLRITTLSIKTKMNQRRVGE